MTVTEVIDQVIERSDNIKGTPADYSDRRLRLLDYLREVVDEIWWLRDWPWRMKSGTVTVPAGAGAVVVPADFNDWGHEGGIYGADGQPLDPVSEREILDLREAGHRSDTPDRYSIFDEDSTGMAPTYRKMLQFPMNDAAVTLKLWYQATPPALDESSNNNNLRFIPVQYHRNTIVPGVRFKSQQSKSDARSAQSKVEYEAAKAAMLTAEARDRNRIRQLPSFFGYRRWI